MAGKIYLNFPITLIPPIYQDKDICTALDNIICFAIVAYTQKNKVSLSEALKYFHLTLSDGISMDYLTTKIENLPSSNVMTSIDRDNALKYKKNHLSYKYNTDTIISICGELAIRSIIGVKDYAKCYKGLILSRMAGFARTIDENEYPEAIKKLSGDGGKRQWRKLISSLKERGCAIYVPKGCRGLYASFRLSPVELARKVERLNNQRIKTEYNMSNEELRRAALDGIKNERTPSASD